VNGEESAAWLVPNEIEDELHVGCPCLVNNQVDSRLFQDVFVGRRKRFHPSLSRNWMMTISRPERMLLWHQRSESMLEAIVVLLALATCALILIAFWGLDLLGMRRRRR
jgi:hypothetical protein